VAQYVDEVFIPKVQAVDAVIAQLSPHTRTLLGALLHVHCERRIGVTGAEREGRIGAA
jgi:hypothetical protein